MSELKVLKRRKKNMESEISNTKMNALMESMGGSPSSVCDYKENQFNAEQELKLINMAIDTLELGNNKPIETSLQKTKNNSIRKNINKDHKTEKLEPSKSTASKIDDIGHKWYQKPIGIIGITVFSGIIIHFFIQLINN